MFITGASSTSVSKRSLNTPDGFAESNACVSSHSNMATRSRNADLGDADIEYTYPIIEGTSRAKSIANSLVVNRENARERRSAGSFSGSDIHFFVSRARPEVAGNHLARECLPAVLRPAPARINQCQSTTFGDHRCQRAQHEIALHPVERLPHRDNGKTSKLFSNFFGASAVPLDIGTIGRLALRAPSLIIAALGSIASTSPTMRDKGIASVPGPHPKSSARELLSSKRRSNVCERFRSVRRAVTIVRCSLENGVSDDWLMGLVTVTIGEHAPWCTIQPACVGHVRSDGRFGSRLCENVDHFARVRFWPFGPAIRSETHRRSRERKAFLGFSQRRTFSHSLGQTRPFGRAPRSVRYRLSAVIRLTRTMRPPHPRAPDAADRSGPPDLLKDRLAKLTEHATHVDMIIGAVAQHGLRVAPVAQWLQWQPVRVLQP